MDKRPDEIREEIDATRADMGQTVQALGEKTHVKERAKKKVTSKFSKVGSVFSGASSQISDGIPDTKQVKNGAKRTSNIVKENPLGFGIAVAATGFLAGMLIPSTSVEDQRIGPMSDDLKQQAKETSQEALGHGKEVMSETVRSAKETLKEQSQQHGEELRNSTKQS